MNIIFFLFILFILGSIILFSIEHISIRTKLNTKNTDIIYFIGLISVFILSIILTYISFETGCRDGWKSNSIGSKGACSHHLGVNTELNDTGTIIIIYIILIGLIFYYLQDIYNKKINKIGLERFEILKRIDIDKKYNLQYPKIDELGKLNNDEFNTLLDQSKIIFENEKIKEIKRQEMRKENTRRMEIIEIAIKTKKRIYFLYPNENGSENEKIFLPITKNIKNGTIRGYLFIVNVNEGNNNGFSYKINEIIILQISKIKNIRLFD